jgi:CheY-like chemotaxis protein
VGDEQPERVDVREVLESSLNIARRQIVECARLDVDLAPAREVRANRSRLGQVFLNLLVNACEAVEPGHPESNTISLSCREVDAFVEVTVRDTGVGIPPGDIHRIFDLFYTTKPVGVGTGLGLSICHDLVEALGGSIEVTSQVGVGTEFRVLLPCAGSQPPTLPPPDDVDVWKRAKRMLVVDDDPLVARSVRRLLGDKQEVTLVHDGPSALAELRKRTYDVVLCDVAMPGMDGLMVLEAAQCERLGAAHRFVFMTGSLFSQEWRQRMNAVRAPCVAKPLDMTELTTALAQVLETKPSARQDE